MTDDEFIVELDAFAEDLKAQMATLQPEVTRFKLVTHQLELLTRLRRLSGGTP